MRGQHLEFAFKRLKLATPDGPATAGKEWAKSLATGKQRDKLGRMAIRCSIAGCHGPNNLDMVDMLGRLPGVPHGGMSAAL